jgi:hypothetical protein
MPLSLLFKIGRALFLFIREMWLRDRTFRQFVHDNLSTLVASAGFLAMTVLFLSLYDIVKDQELVINRNENEYAILQREYEKEVASLNNRLDWYKNKYLDLLASTSSTTDSSSGPRTRPVQIDQTPNTQPPTPPAPVSRPSRNQTTGIDLSERWRRLSQ